MTDDRGQMMFDILLGIQSDVAEIKRGLFEMSERLTSLERFLSAFNGKQAHA